MPHNGDYLHCMNCRQPLDIVQSLKSPTEEELWNACQIEEILTNAERIQAAPALENLSLSIGLLRDQAGLPSISALERRLGFATGLLLHWLRRSRVSLPFLLRFSFNLRRSLFQILTDPGGIDWEVAQGQRYSRDARKSAAVSKSKMQQALTEATSETERPPSLKAVARRLRISVRKLSTTLPTLSRQLIAHRTAVAKKRRESVAASTESRIIQLSEQLISEGVYPGFRAIRKRLARPCRERLTYEVKLRALVQRLAAASGMRTPRGGRPPVPTSL